jgi:hypothetical protein
VQQEKYHEALELLGESNPFRQTSTCCTTRQSVGVKADGWAVPQDETAQPQDDGIKVCQIHLKR